MDIVWRNLILVTMDGRLVIFNQISLLRIGNDGLQWRGYVMGEGGRLGREGSCVV